MALCVLSSSSFSSGQAVVSTLAGNGTGTYADGTGTAASFYYPFNLAVDASGNVYVADFLNHRIRKISTPCSLTGVATPASCVGGTDGSFAVTTSNGTSTYSYSWTGGGSATSNAASYTANGLAAGAYSVSVTDGDGCSASTNVTVTELDGFRVYIKPRMYGVYNVSKTGATDGSFQAFVSGANGSEVYTWTGPGSPSGQNPSGLGAGKYRVFVRNNLGCISESGALNLREP